MKKIILSIVVFLLVAQLVFAGVTNPLPTELNLLKGETGRFKFQIQTVASNEEVFCNYYLEKESPLEVKFDPSEITVAAGTVRDVFGSVKVPKSLDFGFYEEFFCISCSPTDGKEGAAVAIDTCGLPIKVNVVSERSKDNMYVPPKPIPITIVLLAVGIILALAWLVKEKWPKPVTRKQARRKKRK